MLHPYSLIIPLLILMPNLLFMKWKPINVPADMPKQNTLLSAAEGIGRTGVFALPLFYTVQGDTSYEIAALIGMALSLGLYYLGWARFFSGNRKYALLYSPMFGIPVPLAVAPAAYFLLASAVLHSPYLLILGVLFAFSHIINSLKLAPK